MDEELSGQAPDHEAVPADAADQVRARAATAIAGRPVRGCPARDPLAGESPAPL
jgi:hypothetical protein